MNETHKLNTSIVEIAESKIDSTVKEITMLVHKLNFPNANGLDFLKEHAEKYMNTLVDKPVTTKYYEEKDDLGTHEQVVDKKTGKIVELNTICIGTITDVWIDKVSEDDDTEALFAKATIWSYKYPKIMACIEKLFSNDTSTSSVEIEIYKYNEGASKEYRNPLEFSYLSNTLLGSTVTPADSDAGILTVTDKEIAEAVKHDLEINNDEKGDGIVTDTFNKGIEIKFHGEVEINAIKLSEISNQIYNLLNPINPKNNSRKYNYYIRDMYNEYCIVEDENDYRTLYKIGYSVSDNLVVLDAQDLWVKGYYGFIPDNISVDELLIKVTELNNKITELQEEAKKMADKSLEELQVELSNKESEITNLTNKISELEIKVTELNETIVGQETSKKELEEKVTELNSNIEQLNVYKEKVETAEKDAKVAELNAKYSKLISKEVFESEEVQNAITELNSQKLNEIVVSEVSKEKVTETASKSDDVVTVVASKQEDLIPQGILQKYGIEA